MALRRGIADDSLHFQFSGRLAANESVAMRMKGGNFLQAVQTAMVSCP